VLRIWDVYPGSRTRICIKEFKYFNTKKWFLSSRNYDPDCSSRIRIWDPDPDFLAIPGTGVKKEPDSGSRIRSTGKNFWNRKIKIACTVKASSAKFHIAKTVVVKTLFTGQDVVVNLQQAFKVGTTIYSQTFVM
jgi:hypothetical protein